MKLSARLATVACAAAMLAGTAPAQAGSYSATYVASVLCCTERPNVPGGVGTVSIGGIRFTPTATGAQLDIDETTAPGAGWQACQEGPLEVPPEETPNSCGGGDDVTVTGCSTGNKQNLTGMRANIEVIVFIGYPDTECEGVATTGKITATW